VEAWQEGVELRLCRDRAHGRDQRAWDAATGDVIVGDDGERVRRLGLPCGVARPVAGLHEVQRLPGGVRLAPVRRRPATRLVATADPQHEADVIVVARHDAVIHVNAQGAGPAMARVANGLLVGQHPRRVGHELPEQLVRSALRPAWQPGVSGEVLGRDGNPRHVSRSFMTSAFGHIREHSSPAYHIDGYAVTFCDAVR
jgi:hypothetical protein